MLSYGCFLIVLSICSGCIFIHSYLIKITLKRNKLFQTKYQKSFQVLLYFLIYLLGFWSTFSQYMLLWSDAFFSRSSFVSALALNLVLYFYDIKTFKEANSLKKIAGAIYQISKYMLYHNNN